MNQGHQFPKEDPSPKFLESILFKITPDTDIRSKILDAYPMHKDVIITDVSVYKTLRAPPSEYHEFVVLETDVGAYISLENLPGGVYMGCSNVSRERIVNYVNVGDYLLERKKPVELLKRGISHYPIDSLQEILNIKSDIASGITNKNSTHFAERVFYDVATTGQLAYTVSNESFDEEGEIGVIVAMRKILEYSMNENVVITDISVYKTPLDVIGSSSGRSVPGGPNGYGIQLTPVDYHAFVVMETNVGILFSLERNEEGIYVGSSKVSREMVVNYEASMRERKKPVELLKQDTSDNFSMDLLLEILKKESRMEYCINNNNCKHFAKTIFDLVAHSEKWDCKAPKNFLEDIGTGVLYGATLVLPILLRSILRR